MTISRCTDLFDNETTTATSDNQIVGFDEKKRALIETLRSLLPHTDFSEGRFFVKGLLGLEVDESHDDCKETDDSEENVEESDDEAAAEDTERTEKLLSLIHREVDSSRIDDLLDDPTDDDLRYYLYLIFLVDTADRPQSLELLKRLLYCGKGVAERFLSHFRLAYSIYRLQVRDVSSNKLRSLITYLESNMEFAVYLPYQNRDERSILTRETCLLRIKDHFPMNLNINRSSISLSPETVEIIEDVQSDALQRIHEPEMIINREW